MTVSVNELRSMLEEVLEKARVSDISYRGFAELLACSYGYAGGDLCMRYRSIVNAIRRFIDTVARASNNLDHMEKFVHKLVSKGYRPLLVDCLGLPEVYEIYASVVEEYGVLSVSVIPFVNSIALTRGFTRSFEKSSMVSVARMLGTSLYKSIDETVHEELGKPMRLYDLVRLAEARLRNIAKELAKDAMNARMALIVADHGYDMYCDTRDMCYLGHGRGGKLAKIAPIVVVKCG